MGEGMYELKAKPPGEVTLNITMSEEEYKKYRNLSKEGKIEYIINNGVKVSTIDYTGIEYVMEKKIKD